jgi:mannose/fructose/N-acetylgalactosamine-specific phosphotransferase system component IID
VAFLGFPLGGALAYALIGPITTTVQAGLAGAITGAILGAVQWLVLRTAIPLPLRISFARLQYQYRSKKEKK